MKYFTLFCLLLVLNSCISTKVVSGKLIRDCSGVYVRDNNVDWRICNETKLKPEDFLKTVTINYQKVNICKDTTSCLIYHPYARSIRIKKVLRL